MDRRGQILKHVTKDGIGIEIGPWFAPLAPKRDGYNCKSFDVFDTETLRASAKGDANVPESSVGMIESVDLLGSSNEIEQIVAEHYSLGTFDYIISSHNFEHIPNPIKFLQGCQRVLKPGGYLSMAVPNKTTCFDYFRPVTTLGAWLDAYHEDRRKPTAAQQFEHIGFHSVYSFEENTLSSFSREADPANITLLYPIESAYDRYLSIKVRGDSNYYDTHCWVLTPNSFRLILMQLIQLGLAKFNIEAISEVTGNEFFVHLRNPDDSELSITPAPTIPQSVLHSMLDDCAYNTLYSYTMRTKAAEAAELKVEVERCQDMRVSTRAELDRLNKELDRRSEELKWLNRQIDEKDQAYISLKRMHDLSLKRIHNSLTWKIASPFWRLETRSQRKANRRNRTKLS